MNPFFFVEKGEQIPGNIKLTGYTITGWIFYHNDFCNKQEYPLAIEDIHFRIKCYKNSICVYSTLEGDIYCRARTLAYISQQPTEKNTRRFQHPPPFSKLHWLTTLLGVSVYGYNLLDYPSGNWREIMCNL